MNIILIIIAVIIFILLISIKQVNQYERGVRFTLGKYTGVMNPGWRIIIPIFQSFQKVDIRTKAVDVPDQNAITRDNVSVKVNAVIYYKVSDASKAVIEVEDFKNAISQYAQTTMRNIVGEVTLDELLSKRDQIADRIREIVDKENDLWGLKVQNVELKDVSLSRHGTNDCKQKQKGQKRAIIIVSKELTQKTYN
jgi:regulator of protease activity HflC (stomatin/prohibitin superfamily)